MRFVSIVTAVALATVAQAFVIPSSTTDGVYLVTTREDGTFVHTKVSDVSEARSIDTDISSVNERSVLDSRQDGRIWCGCGFTMNHGNCDAAVQALKNQMKPSFVKPGLAYYSIHKNVVAFACNRSKDRSWLLISSQYGDALARITNACGWYIAGATELGDPDQALLYGYQRWGGNDDFCGGATSSPANHC